MVSFDDALVLVGEFGRYQKFIYYFCIFINCLAVVFSNIPIVFLVATPDHWCKSPNLTHFNTTREVQRNLTIPFSFTNGKIEYNQCLQYERELTNWTQYDVLMENTENLTSVKCKSGWEYDDSIYHSTIVSEWDLVCERKMWVATSKSVFLAGFIVGVFLTGVFSDKYGRRKAYLATAVMEVICSLLVPFSPNLTSFLVYRFFSGALIMGNATVAYVLILELVGPSWRAYVAVVMCYMYIAGGFLVVGVAYLIRDWRHLAMALGAPAALQLVNFLFAVTMVYYGLAYGSSDFGGNPYLNFFLGFAVEIPSIILCQVSLRFAGRKTVLIIFNVLGGAALLGILTVPNSYSGAYYITLSLSLIGRLCAVGVFNIIYLYTAELLPTVVRNIGMGTASATARFGGISAQYLMGVKDISIFIPYLTMGGISIIAAILLWPLTETRGKKLPETIMEGEYFGRNEPYELPAAISTARHVDLEGTDI